MAAGEATQGVHHRVLFFEIIAGTRMMSRSIQAAQSEFKEFGRNVKGVFTGIEGDAAKNLAKVQADTKKSLDAAQKSFDDWEAGANKRMSNIGDWAEKEMQRVRDAVAKNYAAQTASAQASYDAQAAAATKAADAQVAAAEKAARDIEALAARSDRAEYAALTGNVQRNQARVTATEGQLGSVRQRRMELATRPVRPTPLSEEQKAGVAADFTAAQMNTGATKAALAGAIQGGDEKEIAAAAQIADKAVNEEWAAFVKLVAAENDDVARKQEIAKAITQLTAEEEKLTAILATQRAELEQSQSALASRSREMDAEAAALKSANAQTLADTEASSRAAADAQMQAARTASDAQIQAAGLTANSVIAAKEEEVTRVVAATEQEIAIERARAEQAIAEAKAIGDANVAAAEKAAGTEAVTSRGASAFAAFNNTMGMAIPVIGGLGLALAGSIALLNGLADKAITGSLETLRLADATKMSTDMIQTNMFMMEKYGVSQNLAESTLVRFSRSMTQNAAVFRELGLSTTDTTTAWLQFADAMANAKSQSDALTIAQKVLGGRGSSGLGDVVAALQAGKAGILAYENELKQLGFILDGNQLQSAALAGAIQNRLSAAFQGMERQVGAAILPDMDALWAIMTKMLSPGGALTNMFTGLAGAIAKAVGWIIGFINGLAGSTMSAKDWQDTLQGAIQMLQDGQGPIDGTGDAIDSVTQAAQENTAAIKALQDQNKSLQDELKRSERAARDETRAIDDATARQVGAIDQQITSLNDKKEAIQDTAQAQEDAINAELQSLQSVDEHQRRSNEDYASYRRRLREDDLKQQLDGVKKGSDAQTKAIDDQIKNLQQQKDAITRAADAMKQKIQDSLQAVQDKVGDTTQANTDAIDKLQQKANAAYNNMGATGQNAFIGIDQTAINVLKSLETSVPAAANSSGLAFRQMVQNWLSDPGGTLETAALTLGEAIGEGIIFGVGHGIVNAFDSLPDSVKVALGILVPPLGAIEAGVAIWGAITGPGPSVSLPPSNAGAWTSGVGNLFNGPSTGAPKFHQSAEGNIFTQPSVTSIAEGYRPEVVIPLTNASRAASLMRATGLDRLAAQSRGAGTMINVQFTGPVADALVGARVVDKITSKARKQGLIGPRGI